MTDDPIKLGAELREMRLALGLTLRDLGAAVGKSHTTIGKIESGARSIRAETVGAVRSYLVSRLADRQPAHPLVEGAARARLTDAQVDVLMDSDLSAALLLRFDVRSEVPVDTLRMFVAGGRELPLPSASTTSDVTVTVTGTRQSDGHHLNLSIRPGRRSLSLSMLFSTIGTKEFLVSLPGDAEAVDLRVLARPEFGLSHPLMAAAVGIGSGNRFLRSFRLKVHRLGPARLPTDQDGGVHWARFRSAEMPSGLGRYTDDAFSAVYGDSHMLLLGAHRIEPYRENDVFGARWLHEWEAFD